MISKDLTVTVVPIVATQLAVSVPPSFSAPIHAGAVITPIIVTPSTWVGSLSLSGVDAGLFSIGATSAGVPALVATNDITNAGTFAVTVTATP